MLLSFKQSWRSGCGTIVAVGAMTTTTTKERIVDEANRFQFNMMAVIDGKL